MIPGQETRDQVDTARSRRYGLEEGIADARQDPGAGSVNTAL